MLGHGCVQEEIRFVICPELMISMLFTEVLRPNEALMMIGEWFSSFVCLVLNVIKRLSIFVS